MHIDNTILTLLLIFFLFFLNYYSLLFFGGGRWTAAGSVKSCSLTNWATTIFNVICLLFYFTSTFLILKDLWTYNILHSDFVFYCQVLLWISLAKVSQDIWVLKDNKTLVTSSTYFSMLTFRIGIWINSKQNRSLRVPYKNSCLPNILKTNYKWHNYLRYVQNSN